jgi:hypothetical protein
MLAMETAMAAAVAVVISTQEVADPVFGHVPKVPLL